MTSGAYLAEIRTTRQAMLISQALASANTGPMCDSRHGVEDVRCSGVDLLA